MLVEAHKDLHYATKSLLTSQFNWSIKFLSLTKTVTYFTIYDQLTISKKLKIWLYNFLIDLDRKIIKLTLSETSQAQIDKILKMPLAPPRGREEALKVMHMV